jgi:hypothetical protein
MGLAWAAWGRMGTDLQDPGGGLGSAAGCCWAWSGGANLAPGPLGSGSVAAGERTAPALAPLPLLRTAYRRLPAGLRPRVFVFSAHRPLPQLQLTMRVYTWYTMLVYTWYTAFRVSHAPLGLPLPRRQYAEERRKPRPLLVVQTRLVVLRCSPFSALIALPSCLYMVRQARDQLDPRYSPGGKRHI